MNYTFKKIISFFLCVVMTSPCAHVIGELLSNEDTSSR